MGSSSYLHSWKEAHRERRMTSVTDIMNLTTINNNVNYNCDMVLDLEYVTLTAALCATMCLFGLVYTFLGKYQIYFYLVCQYLVK